MDPGKGQTPTLRLGEFEFDRATRTLRHHGRAVPVGARALDVLAALVAARGELVTKDELLRQAWPGLVVEEANVQVQVSALRKALGADAVATVPSLGYRLALPVVEADSPAVRHNLAAERTPFVGRAAALAEARARLDRGVLLTLIGIGGSGKTRLARRLAEQALARFEDGVWWVDLAPLDRAEQLVPAVAQALGCRLDGTRAPLEALARAVHALRALLVLDNCEHLTDAVAVLLERVLEAAPGLRVVATSREALGVRGDVILQVKPMDLPPPEASPEQVWSSDAASLFVQAAQIAAPHLPLTDDSAPTVAALCRRLDGIPLALELAASQLQVLAPEQLLEILQRRFHLSLGARRSLPRQQTLQAVIRWSVETLAEPERQLLVALAACAGGCDLGAAQALAGPVLDADRVVPALARLADRSLISVQHVAGAGRYHLLETVRQYVQETLLPKADEAVLHDRHCHHYLQRAEALQPQLSRDGRARALLQLDLERENMVRAIDGAVTRRQWTLGARYVHALLPHWTARAWMAPGLELAEAVLAVARPEDDRWLASRLMTDTANLALRMGRMDRTRALALDALQQARHASSIEHELDALLMRAFCDLLDGDPAAVVPELEAMLERTLQARLPVQHGRVLSSLGQAHMQLGRLDAAREVLEQARVAYQQVGNPTGAALETVHLAWVAVRSNDAAGARRLLEGLARRETQIDHHAYACFTLFAVACLAALEGQWARCLRAHLAALRHLESGHVADSRLRRQERERDIARARQALDAETQRAAEREAATGSVRDHLAWAFEGLLA